MAGRMEIKMQLMDVTLRENIEYDGLLNYEQGLEYLKYVAANISSDDIQFVELGYVDTSWYSHPQYDPDYLEKAFKIIDGKFKLSAIIHPDRADIKLWDKELISQLSVVRLVNQDDSIPECAREEVEYLHSLGVNASVNIAYVMRKPLSTVADMYDTALSFNPDIVYCADSSGSAMPNQVADIIHLLQSKQMGNKVGMHLHDHTAFAMANAVLAYREGVDFTDFSVTGDGKGGGNLKTELFLPVKRILDEKPLDDELFYGILDYVNFYEKLIGRETRVNVENYLNSLGGLFHFKSATIEKLKKQAKGDDRELIREILDTARSDGKLTYSDGRSALI